MNQTDTIMFSDLHIRSEECNAPEFLETVESWAFKQLIANGDLHEKRKPINKEQFEIVNFLSKNREKVVIIGGNHDPVENGICRLTGIKKRREYRWNTAGKKCCARHGDGHGFDLFSWLFQEESIDWAFSSFLYLLRKVKIGAVDSDYSINGFHDGLSLRVAERAAIYAGRQGIDMMFCGHTHFPMHHTFTAKNGKVIEYYNSGAWVGEICTFVTLDAEGQAQLHYATNQKSGP